MSVAEACCRQAALAGHDVTLLMLCPTTGHASEFGGFNVESLDATPPYTDTPRRIVDWLRKNPQDVVLLNGCEQADIAIPHIPNDVKIVYVVHDTASRYFEAAVRNESSLDAIVAVAENVAARFRDRLEDPDKLHTVLNGTFFPIAADAAIASTRSDDLVYLGGDKPIKGCYDVLSVWNALQKKGFSGHLHWFGEVGSRLKVRIAQLPSSDRILLHGRKPRQAIFDAALHSKVVLMLSRVEPFGMVTIECLGMGCLASAWDIKTGTREIVDSENCAFAPLGDSNLLADRILEMISNHGSRYKDAVAHARSNFDDSAMWVRYSKMLEWLLKRSSVTRSNCDSPPPEYLPPVRFFQILPNSLRQLIREAVGRSPKLGYFFRDFRGR